eukprot:12133301-Prorocentrum_lima.AAC.1
MTSSLVGSEMCIRDSRTTTTSVRLLLLPHMQLDKRTNFSTINVPKAVSYTHLTLPTICSV